MDETFLFIGGTQDGKRIAIPEAIARSGVYYTSVDFKECYRIQKWCGGKMTHRVFVLDGMKPDHALCLLIQHYKP